MLERPHRKEKILELLHRTVGEILEEELDTPPGTMVTVSGVHLTPNRQEAHIGVTVFPFEQSSRVYYDIESRVREIQHRLNREMKMRPVPKVIFSIDASEEKGHRIYKLLEGAKEDDEDRASR
jgi:ribosome-binding factor A